MLALGSHQKREELHHAVAELGHGAVVEDHVIEQVPPQSRLADVLGVRDQLLTGALDRDDQPPRSRIASASLGKRTSVMTVGPQVS